MKKIALLLAAALLLSLLAACGDQALGQADTPPATTPETTIAPMQTPAEVPAGMEQDYNAWIKIPLVALVCFAAAITATVIILKKKKGE